MLSKDDIDCVRRTWAMAATNGEKASFAFYSKLFQFDPSTKTMFAGDLTLQARKLTETLSFIVDHLDDLDVLVPAAKDLARRHVDYHVVAEHYKPVGAALISTFKQLLGAKFTSRDEEAWRNVYTILADVMIDAAYSNA